MAELICTTDFTDLKACEGTRCTLLFVDTTRGRARRWCSIALCGNRFKASAIESASKHRIRPRGVVDIDECGTPNPKSDPFSSRGETISVIAAYRACRKESKAVAHWQGYRFPRLDKPNLSNNNTMQNGMVVVVPQRRQANL